MRPPPLRIAIANYGLLHGHFTTAWVGSIAHNGRMNRYDMLITGRSVSITYSDWISRYPSNTVWHFAESALKFAP